MVHCSCKFFGCCSHRPYNLILPFSTVRFLFPHCSSEIWRQQFVANPSCHGIFSFLVCKCCGGIFQCIIYWSLYGCFVCMVWCDYSTRVYRWSTSLTSFQALQYLATNNAQSVKQFTVSGMDYIVVANSDRAGK